MTAPAATADGDCVNEGDRAWVDKRLVGVCHHFMLFLVAMLRAKGIPARARCGFGSYFNPGFFEDHWVCGMDFAPGSSQQEFTPPSRVRS